jgi:hypothetical protein
MNPELERHTQVRWEGKETGKATGKATGYAKEAAG